MTIVIVFMEDVPIMVVVTVHMNAIVPIKKHYLQTLLNILIRIISMYLIMKYSPITNHNIL